MASTATTSAALEHDADPSVPPVSVPDVGDAGEGGKLKMIVQLVKKCLGVKDIASMRLSLPASLLEPIPNLEYWHYLDRPDLFAAINESEDAFERMLAALRWSFSKDLKFIHGKVCKPYNSVLGEHFRAHWDVIPVSYPSSARAPEGDRLQPPIQHLYLSPAAAESVYSTADTPIRSETASVKSGKSGVSSQSAVSGVSTKSGRSGLSSSTSVPDTPTRTTPATSPDLEELEAELAQLKVDGDEPAEAVTKGLPGNVSTTSVELIEEDSPTPSTSNEPKRVRTTFLTEQVSHHPPVSAFYASCPTRQISMCGIDQISAKVSGTTVRVAPGSLNKGIFLNVEGGHGEGERYHVTHPAAHVNGILRGSFYVTICESVYVTCTGGPKWTAPDRKKYNLRAVVDYKEESWLGKPHFALEGVIHIFEEDDDAWQSWTKVKHVPKEQVVATLSGSWKHIIKYKLNPSFFPATGQVPTDDWIPLIDLSTLFPIPKIVRDLERQEPRESRKLWEGVTERLLRKEYGDANRVKHSIEQRQREEEAARRARNETFVPKYFQPDIDSGMPLLTEDGKKALEEERKETPTHPLEQ